MTRDPSLYRPGVGLVLTNGRGHIWLGERRGWPDSWQLPQGGIEPGEEIEEAMWRELAEEVGTASAELLGSTDFQFASFVFFALALITWHGSGPLSLDHLFANGDNGDNGDQLPPPTECEMHLGGGTTFPDKLTPDDPQNESWQE